MKAGDGTSRMYTSLTTGSVNDLTGFTHTAGLVTRFQVAIIPEPHALSLGLLAFGALGLQHWRRNRRRTCAPASHPTGST